MVNFEKEAQQRSVTKMLGNAINPMEWVRQMSSSKYRRLISAVDSIDKVMRGNILRLRPDLRERLHQARMAMKNREFRRVFQYSNSIIDSVNGVFVDQMDELDALGREVYAEFSKDTMDEWERKKLEEELGVRKPQTIASQNNELIIEAGVTQWLQEKIPTKREIEGVLFDKIFRNMQGKQQEAARQALAIAERTYDLIKEAFDALDSSRRDIVEYVKLARKYQHVISVEKDKLKRMYTNPANGFGLQESTQPPEAPPPQAPTPPVQIPPTTSAPPVVQQNAPPIQQINPSGNKDEAKEVKAINELLTRAKTATQNGDVGIGIALLVKASEICDKCGNEEVSVGLLKIANELDLLRGQTMDVTLIDDYNECPATTLSNEDILATFRKGHIVGTPKDLSDNKSGE